jgi:iron(III) transport system substrate-binding protein
MKVVSRRDFVLIALLVAVAATGQVEAQALKGKLVLYTSQPERDASQTVAAFKRVRPGVEVEVFRSGTTEVMGKLAAEFAAGQPRPDVLLLADAATMEALKKDGRLLAYPEAKVEGFEPGSYDAERTYFGSKLITTGIAVNTAAKFRPASWADLAKPEFKGQIAMPSPLYSGAAAIMLGTMTARSDLGWGFFERLRAADAIAVRGNGAVMTAVATGEKSYGVLVDFMAFNAKAKGSPIDFIFPAEGLPAVTEPVAILKTTQNAAAARAFVDFILSDEGQKLAVSMGYIPAKSSVGMPSWYPAGTKINLMPTDISKVVQMNSANLKRFAELFGN